MEVSGLLFMLFNESIIDDKIEKTSEIKHACKYQKQDLVNTESPTYLKWVQMREIKNGV